MSRTRNDSPDDRTDNTDHHKDMHEWPVHEWPWLPNLNTASISSHHYSSHYPSRCSSLINIADHKNGTWTAQKIIDVTRWLMEAGGGVSMEEGRPARY